MARPGARFATIAVITLTLSACDSRSLVEPGGGRGDLARSVTAVTATAINGLQVNVSWTDPTTDEAGFELHRSTTGPGGTYSLHASLAANVTSYSDSRVVPEAQYCYKVRSHRVTGKKTTFAAFSPASCANTPAPPPGLNAPSGLQATSIWSNVNLTWTDNSSTETGFRLDVSYDAGATWTATPGPAPANATTKTHEPQAERPICYRLVAFNAVGVSLSNMDCTVLLREPANVVATALPGPAMRLTWTDQSSFEEGYEVIKHDGVNLTVLATLGPNAVTWLDASPITDRQFTYSVRAIRDGGYTRWVGVLAMIVTTAPLAPSYIGARPEGSTRVLVDFYAERTNQRGFRVERSLNGGATWSVLGDAFWSGFIDSTVVAEAQACYRVIAYNEAGSSPSSTACTIPPAAPSALTWTLTSEGVAFSWTDNSASEDGFLLQQAVEDCSFTVLPYCYEYWATIATVGANVTTVLPQGFTTWGIRVVATRDGGISDESNFVWVDFASAESRNSAPRPLRPNPDGPLTPVTGRRVTSFDD